LQLKRKFIGVEINEKYFQAAEERLKATITKADGPQELLRQQLCK